MDELLHEHDGRREECPYEWKHEELPPIGREPWMEELGQMRDEIEHLRTYVTAMAHARSRAPRAPADRRRRPRPVQDQWLRKKLAPLLLIADLV